MAATAGSTMRTEPAGMNLLATANLPLSGEYSTSTLSDRQGSGLQGEGGISPCCRNLESNLSTNSEVEILKQLVHPCVTRMIEVVSDQNNFVIVMEFAEGGELEHQVELDRFYSNEI